MSKQIILQRKVEVQCWHVLGQVSKARKRVEIMPVLLHVKKQGSTNVRDVAKELLFGEDSRRVAASRLLLNAQNLGLLEQKGDQFVLTATGEMAIETEEVFVPEEGTWQLWASEDPLFSAAILHIKEWNEPNSFDEVMGKDKGASKKRKMARIPRWLHSAIGVTTKPAASDDGVRRCVDDLQDNGESIAPNASLKLVWNVSAGTLQLVGKLDGREVKTALAAPQVSAEDVWQQLLEGKELWRQWDASYDALQVDFDNTDASEREAMARDLDFDEPEVRGLKKFEKCTVTGVELRAASASDAQLWAQWRLPQRIRDYATATRFSQWQQEAAQPFIDEFQPRLSTRREMVVEAWHNRGALPAPSVWHLVAAQDWGM